MASLMASFRVRLPESTPTTLAPSNRMGKPLREVVAHLGYPKKPADTAIGFDYDTNFRDSVEKESKTPANWDVVLAGRPTILQFWYRQSPDELGAESYHDSFLIP